MKKQHILIVALISLLLTTSLFADSKNNQKKFTKQMEENYLVGVNSENLGLRVSCAYYLGEMKSEKAVIPLLKMLRSENNDGARVMAALSLVKIEDNLGLYMVAQQGIFNDSPRVRRMCNKLYNAYKITEAMKGIQEAVSVAQLVK